MPITTTTDFVIAVAGALRTGDQLALDELAAIVDGWSLPEDEQAALVDLIDAAAEATHERAAV